MDWIDIRLIELLTSVVGSKLHELDTETSDTDYATVYCLSLRDALSPFRDSMKSKAPKGGDDHSYHELRRFVSLCAKGNPTALEILWSNKIEHQEMPMAFLYGRRHKLLAKKAVYDAHRGYAHQQWKRYENAESSERRNKAMAARCRVLLQGWQLLSQGDFSPQVESGPVRDILYSLKQGDWEPFNEASLMSKPYDKILEEALDFAYNISNLCTRPDYDWLERFVEGVYLEYGLNCE